VLVVLVIFLLALVDAFKLELFDTSRVPRELIEHGLVVRPTHGSSDKRYEERSYKVVGVHMHQDQQAPSFQLHCAQLL
jgi:hypothetical protein